MPEPRNESSGPLQSIRRAVTLPTKLNPHAQRGSAAPNLSENVIFYHPSARVVHFAPRALVPIPSSSAPSDFDYPVDTIETLPWRSATERTVATAPLRLERGLTVFLKCGNVVHAILKNSQCWCVDGVSKFVLRIRPLTYYRIELPHETVEDKALVENLKAALPTVLRYEVTPCPFKRAFTVELPEEATAPRRKKAWKPKERKDGVPLFSGSNQGSHLESKSDWPDSASTGDDTDGAATDDSGLTSQRTPSTASEAAPVGDESPTAPNDYGAPGDLASIRRSITESPQTFTSLRAKFDAVPVLAEPSASEELVTKEETSAFGESAVKNEPVLEGTSHSDEASQLNDVEEASTPGDSSEAQEASPPEVILTSPGMFEEISSKDGSQGVSVTPVAPTSVVLEETPRTVPPRETPNSVSAPEEFEYDLESKAISGSQEAPEAGISAAASNAAPDILPVTQDLITERASVPSESSDAELDDEDHDVDHDISFSSSPNPFHSVGLPSPSGTSSAHTTPVENHGSCETAPSVAAFIALLSEKQAAAPEVSEHSILPGMDIPSTVLSQEESGGKNLQPELKMPKHIVREDPRKKPSERVPSTNKLDVTSATSPITDFHHMSTEFRRRAQATRQRDVSPMPPPSTIYQPSPNDQASSLLSKALSLVLVPPIHLFIILLHVAARIVISPTLNSTRRGSSAGSHSSNKEPVTEDDFSFPLEREPSSEYEDAEMSRKPDPWDLD